MGTVECIVPILRVADLGVSVQYYVSVLGFSVDWGGEPDAELASVSRDGHAIMLCRDGQGQPGTWVWIGVEDIGPLVQRFRERGAIVRREPANHPWAYEVQIEDPDGHVLRFGSEPLPEA